MVGWRAACVGVLACAAACKEPRWKPRAATELQIAGYTLPIPVGWRSMAELTKPDVTLSPNTVGMMPQENRDGILTASILVTWSPRGEIEPWSTCEQATKEFSRTMPAPAGGIQSTAIDDSVGCTWQAPLGRLNATYGMRAANAGVLSVQCLIDGNHDPAAVQVCAQVLAVVQLPRR